MKSLSKLLEICQKNLTQDDSSGLEDQITGYIRDFADEAKRPKTKSHHIGIEIEFYSKSDRDDIIMDLGEAGLLKKVSIGYDGSLDGDNGHEIRILDTERGIFKTLEEVCMILKKHKARVNRDCGLHVHLDMRNRDGNAIFEKFLKIQTLMHGLVKRQRIGNSYCLPATPNEKLSKYRAFHLHERYKTLEVRLHHGSVDYNEISNWVRFLVKMVKHNIKKKVHKPQDLNVRGQVKSYLKKVYNPENIEYYDSGAWGYL